MCLIDQLPTTSIPFRIVLVLLPTLLSIGCGESGPATATVRGTITLDGKPLPRGSVLFNSAEPGPPPARANIQQDGTYELQAVPGEYKVIVNYQTETGTILDPDDPAYVAPKSLLPLEYSSLVRTPLKATVTQEPTVVDLEL